ncbi:AMSH-like protease [Phanerochaete sordida]|uniref:AMSH-like protease n=1 Tax=Phanerochaete sordida TaxID=48140 RepID=A0A9P3G2B4_9APHY|nr:AMSH-like protease [Phanerochaete sordida]
MSSSAYPSASHATSRPTDSGQPRSIAELAAQTHNIRWDPKLPLKHWLRTAEKARKTGSSYQDAGDLEAAFLEFAKAATIVVEKLPTHRDYFTLLNADHRRNLAANGQDILECLDVLKKLLVERYENWRANPDGVPPHPDPNAIAQEVARRKQEELLRAQEEERTRQAFEAARIEDEWLRSNEQQRKVQGEAEWARRPKEARQRDSVEAHRAAEAREAAHQERMSMLRAEDEARRPSDEEERSRRRVEERRRQEQEGILRRQQEAEAAAREARRHVASSSSGSGYSRVDTDVYQRRSQEPETPARQDRSSASPHPSRPPSSSQQRPHADMYGAVPPRMPIENPTPYVDETDGEGRSASWNHSRQSYQTPTKTKHLNAGIMYPPPVTTTSPAPQDAGPIEYPNLMSQHQLKQGYVPSLRSMFSYPNTVPPDSAALLLETKPGGALYANLLPSRSTPADAVIPPYIPGMPIPDHRRPYDNHRGPAPSRAPPPVVQPPPPPPPPPQHQSSRASRIVRGASTEGEVQELKPVRLPRECLNRFVSIARVNTTKNKETCGLLLGKDQGSKYVVTTLLIPKQHSTSDTCTMDEEELVLMFTEERHLITLGWIHTHPTQSCFMSSVDLHTHSGFQRMLPESFAVVCAPNSSPSFGIFCLTDPGGLQVILECTAKEAFHPHPDVPIYTDCDKSHVQVKDLPLEIVDLRES